MAANLYRTRAMLQISRAITALIARTQTTQASSGTLTAGKGIPPAGNFNSASPTLPTGNTTGSKSNPPFDGPAANQSFMNTPAGKFGAAAVLAIAIYAGYKMLSGKNEESKDSKDKKDEKDKKDQKDQKGEKDQKDQKGEKDQKDQKGEKDQKDQKGEKDQKDQKGEKDQKDQKGEKGKKDDEKNKSSTGGVSGGGAGGANAGGAGGAGGGKGTK